MTNKASFCGTQAKPCGRALPGLDRTSGFAFRSTYAKRRPTQNRTSHLLFNPDILTCYEHPGKGAMLLRLSLENMLKLFRWLRKLGSEQ
jgi:hypothetical protein